MRTSTDRRADTGAARVHRLHHVRKEGLPRVSFLLQVFLDQCDGTLRQVALQAHQLLVGRFGRELMVGEGERDHGNPVLARSVQLEKAPGARE